MNSNGDVYRRPAYNGWERTRTGERNCNSNARGIFGYRWVVLHKLLNVGILIILIIKVVICPNYPFNIYSIRKYTKTRYGEPHQGMEMEVELVGQAVQA